MIPPENKYVWSENEETFNSEVFDTEEFALEDATQYVEPSTIVYIGKVKHVTIDSLVFASRIIDDAGESAYEQCGESAEDFLSEVSKAQEDDLQLRITKVFGEWLEAHNLKPNFFAVKDVKEHVAK